MIVLAHRGWWRTLAEKNSLMAFERAFRAGFGVELDVRDLDGDLVVSHDPPRGGALALDEVLRLYAALDLPGRLAINIKADGLCGDLTAMLAKFGATSKSFVFDMSTPDMRPYLKSGVPVFTRFSDVEPTPVFYAESQGVWVDSFAGPWASTTRAISELLADKYVALVSPELHGMPHHEAWADWVARLSNDVPEDLRRERLMICTDLPDAAAAVFSAPGNAIVQ